MRNKEYDRQYQRKYSKLFPEKVAEAQRKWRESHKEQWNTYMNLWRSKNPERVKKLSKSYRINNIDKIRVKEAQKNTKRRQATGSFTKEEWLSKKELFKYKCPCCGRKEGKELILTIDHIIPIRLGGTHDISNIQPLCPTCNFRKKIKIIKYEPW